MTPTINVKEAKEEFRLLKQDAAKRNRDYYLLRQAVKGNFRWPRSWPGHVPKVTRNLCKPIAEQFATYLMGNGFHWNVDRPNSVEYRESAERAEKILKRLLSLSHSPVQFNEGAKCGSKLGRTIFKVYKKGKPADPKAPVPAEGMEPVGSEHACFSYCQPDYFYGVPAGAEDPGMFSVVYYSYPVDRREAVRRYGPGDYKSEAALAQADRYDEMPESMTISNTARNRNVPVLEVWTPEAYLLEVGGVVKFNGPNPYKWSDSGEGFIPFVVIENIRADEDGFGEADIAQARELNEQINWLNSRRLHVVDRWLNPTMTWEGAPSNYAELVANTIGGGGILPLRLGSNIGFLAHDKPNPAVSETLLGLYEAILEGAGINEAALKGLVSGSINTGPALQVQFAPVLSTINKKRAEWEVGLSRLFAMLLQVQEDIGASTALGKAVVNQKVKSSTASPSVPEDNMAPGLNPDGDLVDLTGADIMGLRDVTISWPGVLPADDFAASQLELQKAQTGLQSYYTTLEKLGTEYPSDELTRVRQENDDPSLKGEKVAEQLRAQTPLIKQQQDQAFQQQQMEQQMMMAQMGQGAPAGPPELAAGPPPPGAPVPFGELPPRERIRQLASRAQPDMEGDFPVMPGAGEPVY